MAEARRDADERLEAITDAFVAALRAGNAPAIDAVVAAHPEFAVELRELLPTVAAVEALASRGVAMGQQRCAVAPTRLGDFRIVREIGRGGMGVVYEAVQESLGRTVALKVLPRPALADAADVERFRREARTAARLHHPGIVPIHAIGFDDDVHWFAMPVVVGVGLDRVLDAVQSDVEVDDPVLAGALGHLRVDRPGRDGWFVRLATLGASLADALEHAHRAGVLHRDVKPANLLLEPDGHAWVTDFGVARALDQPRATRTGELLGTLHYAPPESFAGEVDGRGDVYGLGLTLAELAMRAPVWQSTTGPALVEQVQRGIERSAWRRLRHAPRDFVTVLAKATAVDPDARYATAALFAADLRRFVAGQPVLARRTSAFGHLLAWCRRNRLAAASAAAALLAVCGAAAVGWGAFWTAQNALAGERRASDEARAHLGAERAAKTRTEATVSLLLGLNDTLLGTLGGGSLTDPDAELADVLPTPALTQKELEVLRNVLACYEQVAAAHAEHEGLLAHAVRAFHRAGDVHRCMGHANDAITAYQRAIEFQSEVPTEQRDEDWCVEQAALFRSLAVVRAQVAGPMSLFDFWRARDVLTARLADHPARRLWLELARVHNAIGSSAQQHASVSPGKRFGFERRVVGEAHRQAIAIAARLVDEQPTDRAALLLLARSHRLAAQARAIDPEAPADADDVRTSLALLDDLVRRFPEEDGVRFELAEALSLAALRDVPGAERDGRLATAQATAAELVRQSPGVPEYEALVARIAQRHGEASLRTGELVNGIDALQRAARLQGELCARLPQAGRYTADWLATLRALAQALVRAERAAEAVPVLEQAVSLAATMAPPFGWFAGDSVDRELAAVLRSTGDTEALAVVERRLRERRPPSFPPRGSFGRPR